MKEHKIRFLSVIATFMLISSILSSQALAVARSSKYLDAYGTYVISCWKWKNCNYH